MPDTETIVLQTEDLLLLDKIIAFVPHNNAVLSSQFIRMIREEDGGITLNLSSLSHLQFTANAGTTGDSWTWFLDRKTLSTFISVHSKSKTIKVDRQPDKLILSSGRHKVSFSRLDDITGYAPPDGKGQVETKLNVYTIAAASKFAAGMQVADHLNCVYLKQGNGIYATDSFCLFHLSDGTVPVTLPLPTLVSEAGAVTTGKLAVGKTGASLYYPNGVLYQTVSDNCMRKFPLKVLMTLIQAAEASPAILTLKADKLLHSLGRLSPFARSGDLVHCGGIVATPEFNLVLDIAQGRVSDKVRCETPLLQTFGRWFAFDRLIPWVEFVRMQKGEDIELRFVRGHSILVCTLGKRKAYLCLAEITK